MTEKEKLFDTIANAIFNGVVTLEELQKWTIPAVTVIEGKSMKGEICYKEITEKSEPGFLSDRFIGFNL